MSWVRYGHFTLGGPTTVVASMQQFAIFSNVSKEGCEGGGEGVGYLLVGVRSAKKLRRRRVRKEPNARGGRKYP